MPNKNWIDEVLSRDPEIRKEYEIERLCIEMAEILGEALDDAGVSQRAAAKALGVAESSISRALSGIQNMTLRTAASIGFIANVRFVLEVEALAAPSEVPDRGSVSFRVAETPPLDALDEARNALAA